VLERGDARATIPSRTALTSAFACDPATGALDAVRFEYDVITGPERCADAVWVLDGLHRHPHVERVTRNERAEVEQVGLGDVDGRPRLPRIGAGVVRVDVHGGHVPGWA
jgi:hypothetical protein